MPLSRDELSLIWLLIENTHIEVGRLTNTSPQTLKNRMSEIRSKMGAKNTRHLIWMLRQELEELERSFNAGK